MEIIRDLFDTSKSLDRRIEKVINYDAASEDQLYQEITEYVVTEKMEMSFEKLLDQIDEGMKGTGHEIGVWVSGFYGSGKSSFTKYLGFALEPYKKVKNKPFMEWLKDRFKTKATQQRLTTVAARHPMAVIMLDLASEQLAGASMEEISSVLYWKVMQWAGYSRDKKVAYFEFMIERDNKRKEFEEGIISLTNGKSWKEIQNTPLLAKRFAAQIASRIYPEIWPDTGSFMEITIDEAEREIERTKEMIDLIKRKTGTRNVIFIIDEVGQYIAGRDSLILNLDGLAKNIKNSGGGHAWLIATAQQTLTEDYQQAHYTTAKLFKLKDRFPIEIDLEASDIKEICYLRLLSKSNEGKSFLESVYKQRGEQMRSITKIEGSKIYRSDMDKETFSQLYPFLPQHFDILLKLLGRLAKASGGGIGLRSVIKVIQDILVDKSSIRRGQILLADKKIGILANTVTFYDTLYRDIEKSFSFITKAVEKVIQGYGEESIHAQAAKSIAVLQVLDDFPLTVKNLSALMHPDVESLSRYEEIKKAVDELLKAADMPLNEIDGNLRFMSEIITDLEKKKQGMQPRIADLRTILTGIYQNIFTPVPSATIFTSKKVQTGLKFEYNGKEYPFSGDREEIQCTIIFAKHTDYEHSKKEIIKTSMEAGRSRHFYIIAAEEEELEASLTEIFQCQEITKQKSHEKEVVEYIQGQQQRAQKLMNELMVTIKSYLQKGSFVFQGSIEAVSGQGKDIQQSSRYFLQKVGEKVYQKYPFAKEQAASGTAEAFLKADDLTRLSSKDDPLCLIDSSGSKSTINVNHKALLEIKDYLDIHGHVEGRKLLDYFSSAPYGWTKDTIRYIAAAMLAAGEIVLKTGRDEIKIRKSATAIQSFKNTQSFQKMGIRLREGKPNPDYLLKASERLAKITGEQVIPLEEEISKCVIRHFPDLQNEFAPLSTRLDNLYLPGSKKAQLLLVEISEIMKGDASDATVRLGSPEAELFDLTLWARKVIHALTHGFDETVKNINRQLADINSIPKTASLKVFQDTAATIIEEMRQYLQREDFYDFVTKIQQLSAELKHEAGITIKLLVDEQNQAFEKEKEKLQSSLEWNNLSEDTRIWIGKQFDDLKNSLIETDIESMQTIISQSYRINHEFKEFDILIKTKAREELVDSRTKIVTLKRLPSIIMDKHAIDELITSLTELKKELEACERIQIKWE
jgi:hypothetical protein